MPSSPHHLPSIATDLTRLRLRGRLVGLLARGLLRQLLLLALQFTLLCEERVLCTFLQRHSSKYKDIHSLTPKVAKMATKELG